MKTVIAAAWPAGGRRAITRLTLVAERAGNRPPDAVMTCGRLNHRNIYSLKINSSSL